MENTSFPLFKFSILERERHCVTVGLSLSLYVPFGPWNVEWFIWVVGLRKEAGKALLRSNFHSLRPEFQSQKADILLCGPKSFSVNGMPALQWWCWPLRGDLPTSQQLGDPLDSNTKPAHNLDSNRNKGKNFSFDLPLSLFIKSPFKDAQHSLLVLWSLACFFTFLSLNFLIFELRINWYGD